MNKSTSFYFYHISKNVLVIRTETGSGKWEVVLDGVSVRYEVREGRVVVRRSADRREDS